MQKEVRLLFPSLMKLEAITEINGILADLNFDIGVSAIEECTPSMFVIIFEALFQVSNIISQLN